MSKKFSDGKADPKQFIFIATPRQIILVFPKICPDHSISLCVDSNGGKGVLSYEEVRDLKKSQISTIASTTDKASHIGGIKEPRPSMEGGISLDTETDPQTHSISGTVQNRGQNLQLDSG
jgi:hypothetical protein